MLEFDCGTVDGCGCLNFEIVVQVAYGESIIPLMIAKQPAVSRDYLYVAVKATLKIIQFFLNAFNRTELTLILLMLKQTVKCITCINYFLKKKIRQNTRK